MNGENKYTGLIAGYHVDQPKYRQMVYETTQPLVEIALAAAGLPTDFDLDSAFGAQLDAVGVRVGISRRLKTPLVGVYFALDIDGVGFDQGYWKGPYDPDSGLVLLDDATYRTLLRAKIAANQWDGTMTGAKTVFDLLFDDGTLVFVQDNQDMSITIGMSGKAPSAVLLALLTGGYLSIKPAGVGINNYFITTGDGPMFGFDVDNAYIGGLDHGAWGKAYA